MTDGNRWIALYVLCVRTLMIVLEATVGNAVLPSIQNDLGFDQSSLGRQRLSECLRRRQGRLVQGPGR